MLKKLLLITFLFIPQINSAIAEKASHDQKDLYLISQIITNDYNLIAKNTNKKSNVSQNNLLEVGFFIKSLEKAYPKNSILRQQLENEKIRFSAISKLSRLYKKTKDTSLLTKYFEKSALEHIAPNLRK